MGTLLWSYLGWRRFPRELCGFELRRFFALEASDRRELRVRYPRRLRLGAAIQLGFVRMTGTTLDALDYVPKSLMEYVAHQLMLPAPELATLRALYRNERTRFAHQAWACAHAGLRWPEHTDVAVVAETLTAAAAVTLDRHRLARQAREALFARGCLIPAGRDIDDWVRRAVREVEQVDRERLDAVVPASVRERWLPQLMREVGVGPTTVLEWLRRPPRRRSTKTLGEELAKLSALRALCPPTEQVGIPSERLRAYARRMRRRPIKVRTLEIAALLAVLAARQSDTVLRLIEMRIAEVWRWAHALVHPAARPAVPEEVARTLAVAAEDAALSDADYRAEARRLLAPWAGSSRFRCNNIR